MPQKYSSDTLFNTQAWFAEARPEPTAKHFNVQLGVHMEEFGEMLDELTPRTPFTKDLIDDCNKAVKALAQHVKTSGDAIDITPDNRLGFLDAIVDQIVTATGTAYMADMDPLGGLNEVNGSNWSKFVDGKAVFDENGKIAKGPSYYKANLRLFI